MTPEELESENQKLKATLIDCRAEYLLFLDENPNAFAWDFDELSREAQDRYRKDARESLEIEEPLIAIQLREAETKIAELDDAVSGNLKNITELEAQFAAIKEVAKWERASRLRDQVDYETDDEMMQEFCRDACRQLAEEHPEIDWKK
jgi:hypothetical protein